MKQAPKKLVGRTRMLPSCVPKEDNRSFGSKVGGFIGDAAQKLFKSITGFGDYEVHQNSLIKPEVPGPPQFNPGSGRSVTVKHREFIQDIVGTVAYSNQVILNLNPGLVNTFPWLCSVAEQFEQYRIKGMVFEYKTTSATALVSGTNTAMGVVMMATQYNANNPAFLDKIHLENYDFATSCVPSTSMLHPIECSPVQTSVEQLYVRSSYTTLTSQDLRLYDLGLFQLSTVGFQGTNTCGELWVTYEVEFYKPKLGQIPSLAINEKFQGNGVVTSTIPIGTSITLVSGNQPAQSPAGTNTVCPFWVSTASVNLGILPVGNYLITFYYSGTSATLTAPIMSLTGAITGPPIFEGSADTSFISGNNAASNFLTIAYSWTISSKLNTGNILSMATGSTLPGSCDLDVTVEGIPWTG